MPSNYSGNPASYPDPISVPVDGDPRNAASVTNPLKDLADRTANLNANVVKTSGAQAIAGNKTFNDKIIANGEVDLQALLKILAGTGIQDFLADDVAGLALGQPPSSGRKLAWRGRGNATYDVSSRIYAAQGGLELVVGAHWDAGNNWWTYDDATHYHQASRIRLDPSTGGVLVDYWTGADNFSDANFKTTGFQFDASTLTPGSILGVAAGSTVAKLGFGNLHELPFDVLATVGFQNSWANVIPAGYWKDAFGRAHLKGTIQGGTTGTVAFTLPVGYRPFQAGIGTSFAGAGGANMARIDIATNGNVTITFSGGGTPAVPLDSVSFDLW